jgi:hypothetical protein
MHIKEVFVICLLRRKEANIILVNKGNKINIYAFKGLTKSGKLKVKGMQKEYRLASSLLYLLLVPSN